MYINNLKKLIIENYTGKENFNPADIIVNKPTAENHLEI